MKPDKEALIDEENKLKRLRFIIDLTLVVIRQTDLPLSDARKLVADAKQKALCQGQACFLAIFGFRP